jgi:hypothetical protein
MSRKAVVLALSAMFATALALIACSKQNTEAVENPPTAGAPAGVPEIKLDRPVEGVRQVADTAGADASFKVAVHAPPAVAPGAETIAKVSVTPGPGWKMNLEYPTKLTLTAPEGVQTPTPVLDGKNIAKLVESELAFDVKLTAAKAGTYKVDAELKFAVCTPETCDPKKQTVAIELVAN